MPLGNVEFCFNVDGTGLQTFGGNTMAHWAWHSFPMPPGCTADQIPSASTFQKGRPMNMAGDQSPPGAEDLRNWMFHNPHGMNLGRLRLCWSNGREIAPGEVSHLSAQLDLWSGEFNSTFDLGGQPAGGRFQERRDHGAARRGYALDAPGRDTLEVSCAYSAQSIDAPLPSYAETAEACAERRGNY